ncbi:class I SAM-dependent methyltransferase [Trebonia kvetii]|uniref:Class I SAM-dependent methyltransferase n=1 Tax=Trebonia kvetii TaxID=2480626 RepID=A0A6P2BMR4_9ACTN|nr:class I SAM-dependent methyltransferase [Trebonia kvetii]TVZ00359.1 class I SAM-dependent methyltransferase [Trebonia kvetii]
MANGQQAELGIVQQTLFFPLLARARETERKRPLLRDERAVELVRKIDFDTGTFNQSAMSFLVVLRTMILDWWVRQFLAVSPGGTVVELGTGLNTRFERVDNGSAHWIDLDLPDTIELRRRFFSDTGRRRMIAGSLLDEDWLTAAEQLPGPYFFVADGVLPYLTDDQVTGLLARIAARFPSALIAFDSYPRKILEMEHKMAAKRGIARWQWSCDDPRTLERFGLRLLESAAPTRPPAGLRATLPARYRLLLPVANPVLGQGAALSLFSALPIARQEIS